MIIYPAIDIMRGRCVRLFRGDFSKATEYEPLPLVIAKAYYDAGATHLHVVDLDGARAGTPVNKDVIRSIARSCPLSIQVGGGIRSVEDALALLDAGVSRVVVGSLAVKNISAATDLIKAVGPSRVTLALDLNVQANGELEVAIHGWAESSQKSLDETLPHYLAMGVNQVLCTDIKRDGTLQGPNVELYAYLRRRFPHLEVQASGGVSKLRDLEDLKATQVNAVIIGKALYEGRFTLGEALQC